MTMKGILKSSLPFGLDIIGMITATAGMKIGLNPELNGRYFMDIALLVAAIIMIIIGRVVEMKYESDEDYYDPNLLVRSLVLSLSVALCCFLYFYY